MDNFGPVIIFCTLIICALVFYEIRKSRRNLDKGERLFWAREHKANSTRKKDISSLDYIVIPTDKLPLTPSEDDEVAEYQQTILGLSEKKILNLSDKSNTDLKLEYGVANLTILTEYDNNYTTLINTLTRWGARLFQLEQTEDALRVLEYGISIDSDSSRTFYLLAEYYANTHRPDEIDRLIVKAENIHSLMKASIIKKLNEYRQSCD